MEVEVRRATIADLLTLRTLWEAMHWEAPPPYPTVDASELAGWTEQLAVLLVRDDATSFFRAFLAWEGDVAVGFCAGELKARGFGKPRVFGACHWLYVIPEKRALGIGRHLARECATYLVSLGLDVVEVVATLGDMQWVQRGFVPVSVQHVATIASVIAECDRKDAEQAAKVAAEGNGADHVGDDDAPVLEPD